MDSTTTLEVEFNQAASHLEKFATKLKDEKLLELYGLYKVASIGPCTEPQPGIFNMKARTKWTAWKQASNLTSSEAMGKYVEIVKKSLDWKSRVDCTDQNGEVDVRDLSSSSTFGNSVSSFAMPAEEEDEDGDDSPLIFAWAKDNDLTNLEKWAENTKDINVQDKNGLTPLHWVVDRGHIPACKILLKYGADPTLADNDGSTAIEYAETCEHLEILNLLNNAAKS